MPQTKRDVRHTICVNTEHRSDKDLKRGVCPDCSELFTEVIEAPALEEWLRERVERLRPIAPEHEDEIRAVTMARSKADALQSVLDFIRREENHA